MKNSFIKAVARDNLSRPGIWLLVGIFPFLVQSTETENEFQAVRASIMYHSAPAEQDNQVVIAWNELAYTIANEHDQFFSFIGVRALAMTHLAMHDAINSIEPVYDQYAFKEKIPGVDDQVASSQAAFKVLVNIYPQREEDLNRENQKWLAMVADGKSKDAAIELGNKSAASILRLRKDDGHLGKGNYMPHDKIGSYQYTPGFDWVWIPDLKRIIPFGLKSVSQFRSAEPPALSSTAYADSFNEVKAYGGVHSRVRSSDETGYAHWWAEFAEHSWNRIGRISATQRNLSLHETARLFALINMDIFDIYVASFDSKYYYDTWRPITAIHAADKDNNPATEVDTAWRPEMVTPPWPEYPSAHAAVGAGGAEIVSSVYGSPKITFTMESTSALAAAKFRTYADLNSAADDCALSRIMNGFHFRFATDAGKKQGREVAKYIYTHHLQPINSSTVKK